MNRTITLAVLVTLATACSDRDLDDAWDGLDESDQARFCDAHDNPQWLASAHWESGGPSDTIDRDDMVALLAEKC